MISVFTVGWHLHTHNYWFLLQTLFHGLSELLSYEGDIEDVFMQTFEVSYKGVFGDTITHELKKGGKDIPVTMENRKVRMHNYKNHEYDTVYTTLVSTLYTNQHAPSKFSIHLLILWHILLGIC